jgi:signal transduction histidine kinase
VQDAIQSFAASIAALVQGHGVLLTLGVVTLLSHVFTVDYPDRKGVSTAGVPLCIAAATLGAPAAAAIAAAAHLAAALVRGRRGWQRFAWSLTWGVATLAGAEAGLAGWLAGPTLGLPLFVVLFIVISTALQYGAEVLHVRYTGQAAPLPRVDPPTSLMLIPITIVLLVVEGTGRDNALLLATGSFVGLLVVVRSAINVATLNAELGRAMSELEQQRTLLAETLEQNREFGQIVSHDLRGPLTAIMGYAELQLRGLQQAGFAEGVRHAQRILHNGRRMIRLIDSLSVSSQEETTEPLADAAPVNATSLVETVVNELQPLAGDQEVTLVFDRPIANSIIVTSERMVREILENLISNAIKYTPGGGHVNVSLRPTPRWLEFGVRDVGIGISTADQQRLFTRFFRSEAPEVRAREGTGVGLALTRSLVRRLGGEIRVESELGRGSYFLVSLPVNDHSGELCA